MLLRTLCRRVGPAASCGSRAAMPLRAKVQFPSGQASMATASPKQTETTKDDPEDVLFKTIYGVRTVELNRPKKLNALDGSMIRKIIPRLLEWSKSDMANVIVMKGAGDRALCAGGDVATLALWNREGHHQRSTDYFALEYKLNHLIATYEKPMVVYMDGITMGGGVGLSVHAPFRIATERTMFAMPETSIGLFPDVGGSFFLPRLNGYTGTYLALTSERLMGVNAFYAGIATHYIHSSSLPQLESRLAELRFRDFDTLKQRIEIIDSTIEEYTTGLPHDQPMQIAGSLRAAIDRCFRFNSVPEILDALKAETGEMAEWAKKTLKTLHQRSPTSVYVTLRQMRLGAQWNIAETFVREHQLAKHFMEHPDFTEGVTALLVDKPKRDPKWQPASLEDVKPGDDITSAFFEVDSGNLLELLKKDDEPYHKYPAAEYIGLPSEKAVLDQIGQFGKPQRPREVLDYWLQRTNGKQGIKEYIQEIMLRRYKVVDGKLVSDRVAPVVKEADPSAEAVTASQSVDSADAESVDPVYGQKKAEE